jgi:DivIVA domain-containing protein
MDSPKSSNPAPSSSSSSLDSLRTVEFRQTLRGYHIDDVDEYLERVAVEAEALQEQYRQSNDRIRQAADRIAQLEQMVQQLQREQVSPASGEPAAVSDDALQRTLMLAQKFVDQTQAEAEAEARAKVHEAEGHARNLLREAEERARSLTEDTERRLREDIARLESIRTQLAGDVETVARHMENERNRLRAALGEMLAWVDENVQPAASLLAQPPAEVTATAESQRRPMIDTNSGGLAADETSVATTADGRRTEERGNVDTPLERPAMTGPGAAPGYEHLTDHGSRSGAPR